MTGSSDAMRRVPAIVLAGVAFTCMMGLASTGAVGDDTPVPQATTASVADLANSKLPQVSSFSENFERLRDERNRLLALIPTLRLARDQKAADLRALDSEEARLNDQLRVAPEAGGKSSRVVRVETEIEQMQGNLNLRRKQLEEMSEDEKKARGPELQAKILGLESEVKYQQAVKMELEQEDSAKVATKNSIMDQLRGFPARRTALRAAIDAADARLQEATDRQGKVESAINTLLIPQTAENRFKLWITGAFAALVAIVILGFFAMAYADEKVRQAIFSGEAGIQFLTLFSLVIAIILFGMTGILEGKELSALLGGISGYILGRVTSPKS
jgi:hypothetical protein